MITQHPVETGAPVTDHAFMQPPTVEVRCGWSNSSAQSEGYVQSVYANLQTLQQTAQPFNVTTGKRAYTNMLVRSLMVRTAINSEYTLMVVALCQKILITETSGASSGGTGNTSGDAAVGTLDGSGGATMQNGASNAPDAAGLPSNLTNDVTWPNAASGMGTQSLTPAPQAAAPALH